METLVKILHVIVCIFLMLTVLLQAGKGGGMGAAFGGGSSMGTVFGGSGAGNFLRRLTVGAAIIFMLTSMTLAWMSTPTTDPLEKYWAQQHRAGIDRDKAHSQATGDKKDEDGEDVPEGEGVGPDELIDTPEGEVPEGEAIDTPEGEAMDEVEGATGDEADAIDTPDPGAARPDEIPEPPAARAAPAGKPKPTAKPTAPPAASPVAPQPEPTP